MRSQLLLIAAASLPLAAAPAGASLVAVYENDFTTRTSAGPIGGSTTGSYSLAALVPTTQDGVGQDSWIRRHTGTKAITVVDPGSSGNPYAEFSTNDEPLGSTFYGHVRHRTGSTVDEGLLRVSVDMLAGSIYQGATTGAYFYVGGDLFYQHGAGWGQDTASIFGFQRQSDTITRFSAFDGTSELMPATPTATLGNWYRFIADLDLYSRKYSVNIYDMGSSQPGPASMPASGPVATFSDLAFRDSAEAVTAIGMAAFRNDSAIGYDNIVIAEHSLSRYAHQVLSTEPTIYWRLDETAGSTTAVDSAVAAPYHGSYVGNYTQENPGPRPSDGLFGMDSGNLAAGVVSKLQSGNPGAVQYTSLNTTAGVGTDAYTMQIWFKSTVDAWTDCRLQYLITRSNGSSFSTARDYVSIAGNTGTVGVGNENTGKLRFSNGDSGVYGNQVLNPNQWYHLTIVRDDSAEAGAAKVKVYLNGELEIESLDPWFSTGDGNYLTVGHRPDFFAHTSGGLGFHGLFDEVAIWDRALSAAEVRANYIAGIPEPSTCLLLALAGVCLLPLGRRRSRVI